MDKDYSHNHMEKRARTAYEQNMQRIEKHNSEARKGKYTFEIRANSMADMTQDGYLRRFIRLQDSVHPEEVLKNETHPKIDEDDEEALLGSIRAHPDDNRYIPDSLDWRELGFRTETFNQESCGACYAFRYVRSLALNIIFG